MYTGIIASFKKYTKLVDSYILFVILYDYVTECDCIV